MSEHQIQSVIHDGYSLYRSDCKDMLKNVPNSSVDVIISSPPYCIGKAYEDKGNDIGTFINSHLDLFPELFRVLKDGGSLCWQIGYYTNNQEIIPLDYVVYDIITNKLDASISHDLHLRNRIIWTFGHGLNARHKFSGRHETILWFTKGDQYSFDLDSVRIPQKYPGKKYYKGPRKGQYSCNRKGKNPSDVWDIPNVKANHIEKTIHPCQFPIAIPMRLIKALSPKEGVILDPYMGVGSTGAAAALLGRSFIGSEINQSYFEIAVDRIRKASQGELPYREDKPVAKPNKNTAVAQMPKEFE